MRHNPKCKNCKERFTPYHGLQKYCFKDECKKVWIETESKKQWKKTKPKMDIVANGNKYVKTLQKEINTLVKMIDKSFGYNCIDCNKEYTGQIDAAHYFSTNGDHFLRFNLHNIHSSRAHCNQFDPDHKKRYPSGLELRYGAKYANSIDELPLKYKGCKFSNQEVADAIPVVRKLIRDFDTFKFKDGAVAREQLNKIIGIYN